jgi:hypothetical protein
VLAATTSDCISQRSRVIFVDIAPEIASPHARLMTSFQSLARWLGAQGLICVLLGAVVFVPALARVHQHVGQRPTDDSPRFRWSTCWESVPKKGTAAATIAVVPIIVAVLVSPPVRGGFERPVSDAIPLGSTRLSPPGLRAPPLLVS